MIRIKTEKQIEGIRKSCQLAADTLDFITPYVKAGVTTLELNDKVEQYIVQHGAIPAPLNYRGFPKAICTSLNEVICHGIPDSTVLKDGDIINIDVTTILNSFYGDTSRMFCVGDVSESARKLVAVAQDCLAIGISQVKPGTMLGNIAKAITLYATTRGYSVVHQFCGHGTGLEFHEDPQICHRYTPKDFDSRTMQEGMVFTIEPMLNQGVAEGVIDNRDGWTARTADGKLSAQFEHTILVTNVGVEVLTK